MISKRSGGVLLHITSLPSRFGIGDLGPEAYKFADFVHEAGLTYWQILPLNPVEGKSGYSPYSGLSAFAGNPILISPEMLVKEKYLKEEDLDVKLSSDASRINFEELIPVKVKMLDKAYQRFLRKKTSSQEQQFQEFCKNHAYWLEDFALYMSIKNHRDGQAWFQWPRKLRDREKDSMANMQKQLGNAITKEKFMQFLFFRQWEALHDYCREKNIHFFGDLPFYVGYDSADVWAHSDIFKLNDNKSPEAIAGVPPDYFSETGQLWGMPVFDWKKLRRKKYTWWVHRLSHNLQMFDLIRLDHFRAFSAYWEVPAGETTAINGAWKKGPGSRLFRRLKRKHPQMPIIAEDLGDIDQPVYDLMEKFKMPGMKVLLFAFGDGMPQNPYIPHHHTENAVVYTGTHDNNTTRGWYENGADAKDKKRLKDYVGNEKITGQNVTDHMIRMAWASIGKLAVIPMQDFLNLGEEAIMNRPSTAEGNWLWRVQPDAASPGLVKKIRQQLTLYDRLNSEN